MAEDTNTSIFDKLQDRLPFFHIGSWGSAKNWVKTLISILTVLPLAVLLYCFVDVVCLRDAGIFTDSTHEGLHCLKLSVNFAGKELFSACCASASSYGKCVWIFMSLVGCVVMLAWGAILLFVGIQAWRMSWLWAGEIEGWILALLVSFLTLLNYVLQFKDDASIAFILALFVATIVLIGAVCKLIKFLHGRNDWHRLSEAAKSWGEGTDWIIDKGRPIVMYRRDSRKEIERMEISIKRGFVEVLYGHKDLDLQNGIEDLMREVAEELRQKYDEEELRQKYDEEWKSKKRRDKLLPIVVPWRIPSEDFMNPDNDFMKGKTAEKANKWRILFPLGKSVHDFNALFSALYDILEDLNRGLAKKHEKKKDDAEEVDGRYMIDVREKTSENGTGESIIDALVKKLCSESSRLEEETEGKHEEKR